MIKREDLKKGDMVLVVPNSDFTRNEFASPARVVSIGPKYISVATRWDEDNYFPPDKFNNDKNMFEKDYIVPDGFSLEPKRSTRSIKTRKRKPRNCILKLKERSARILDTRNFWPSRPSSRPMTTFRL